DASRVVSFQVSVNGSAFIDTLGSLRNGAFLLSRAMLETIAGRPFVDGNSVVRLRATDEHGHQSPDTEFRFGLDLSRPATPTPLQLVNDNGTDRGDGITSAVPLQLVTTVPSSDAAVILYED